MQVLMNLVLSSSRFIISSSLGTEPEWSQLFAESTEPYNFGRLPCRLGPFTRSPNQLDGIWAYIYMYISSWPNSQQLPPKIPRVMLREWREDFFFFFLNERAVTILSIRPSKRLGCLAFLPISSTCSLLIHALVLTCISTFEKKILPYLLREESLVVIAAPLAFFTVTDLSPFTFNSTLSFQV
jgi:hypothetical protein